MVVRWLVKNLDVYEGKVKGGEKQYGKQTVHKLLGRWFRDTLLEMR